MKRKMQRTILFILVPILVLILVFAGTAHFFFGPKDKVNKDIPLGFLYAPREEAVPEEYLQMGTSGVGEIISLSPGVLIDTATSKNYCLPEGSPAEKIEYFSHSPGWMTSGGWSYRYALVCGEKYYIIDGRDFRGDNIYGPFSTPGYD